MGDARYRIPLEAHRIEQEVERSRFVTTLGLAETPEMARQFVDQCRRAMPDASHHCWAFVAGPPGATAQIGQSDDGEPHGTAGRPMLAALLHSDVGEIVAVVTRYFGGVLLGKGGLVRAYTGGVVTALETLPTKLRVALATRVLVFDYAHITGFKRLLAGHEAEVLGEDFGADVTVTVRLPVSQREGFERAVTDLTHGAVLIGDP
ncbi:MAG: YigZ family protein [Myxococcales bacterium]|nr:YigZ family protein [Myxococcales bacterium]